MGHATTPHICKQAAWLLHHSQHPPPKTAIAWNSSSAAAIALQRTSPGGAGQAVVLAAHCVLLRHQLKEHAQLGASYMLLVMGHMMPKGMLGRSCQAACAGCSVVSGTKGQLFLRGQLECHSSLRLRSVQEYDQWLHAQLTTPPPLWGAWGVPSPGGSAAAVRSAVSSPPFP